MPQRENMQLKLVIHLYHKNDSRLYSHDEKQLGMLMWITRVFIHVIHTVIHTKNTVIPLKVKVIHSFRIGNNHSYPRASAVGVRLVSGFDISPALVRASFVRTGPTSS